MRMYTIEFHSPFSGELDCGSHMEFRESPPGGEVGRNFGKLPVVQEVTWLSGLECVGFGQWCF